jgi:RNA polymerase-binding transcription factor DksA
MLTVAEIEIYRQRIRSLARQVGGDLALLEDEAAHGLGGEVGGGLSNVPTHLADLGTASYEEEMDLALLANQEHLLDECNAALARIEAGTFGTCEGCGARIPKRRLQAVPFVRHCIDCARKHNAQQPR